MSFQSNHSGVRDDKRTTGGIASETGVSNRYLMPSAAIDHLTNIQVTGGNNVNYTN